jgi:hypothetical protein
MGRIGLDHAARADANIHDALSRLKNIIYSG